jgi:hypothetical protein
MRENTHTAIDPFTSEDIEDVRVIIKAKGKHWGMVPKKEYTAQEAKEIRIELMRVLFVFHTVVDTALEDLNTDELKQKLQKPKP